jgi:uncharacterized OsmC-like protein
MFDRNAEISNLRDRYLIEFQMNPATLKQIQEPLKTKYKSDPQSALITLKASARLDEGVTCKIETGKSMARAGLHPATGGSGLELCSGDMLLESLAACAGVTLNAVATAISFNLRDALVFVEGDLDFRGTLSVDKTAPVGFKEIRLRFEIDSSESQEKIATLISLTERYCVVYQTLIKGNLINVSVKPLH